MCNETLCNHCIKADVTCPDCLDRMKPDPRRQLSEDHAEAMYRVLALPKNAAKGHWQDEDIYGLLAHLRQEYEEFRTAIWGFLYHGRDVQRVIDEGADVSNIVAMISDNLKRRAES